MNFTTKIAIPKSNLPIHYDATIMSFGSCFASTVAEKFDYFKFQNTVNPFGIIFNPVSIENIVERVVTKNWFTENDVFFHNERWHCYEVHSDLSHQNKDELLSILNSLLQLTNQQITQSTHVIITYGTSWIYKLKSTNQVVANCHKVPQNQFEKVLLSVETIEKSIQNTVHLIQKVNPNCHFIFTISPVRHLKDGFVENQQSKAHLITAIHKIIDFRLSTFDYFPSYEIMMDELRDYRFYANDFLHPSSLAIDYIWEQFFQSQIDENVHVIMQEVGAIQKALLHKPFHPNSENHQKFVENLNQKIAALTAQYPQIKF
jgi:hypothetical protein